MWDKIKTKKNTIYLTISPINIQIIYGKNVQIYHDHLAEVLDSLNSIGTHIPVHITLKDWHIHAHHLNMQNMNWVERILARKHFLKSAFQKTDCVVEYTPNHALNKIRSFFKVEPTHALKASLELLDEKMVNPILGITLFDIDLVIYFFEHMKNPPAKNIYAILYPHGNKSADNLVMYLCTCDHIIYIRYLSQTQINHFDEEQQHIIHYIERLGYTIPEKLHTYYMTQTHEILEFEGAASLLQMTNATILFCGNHDTKQKAYLPPKAQQKIRIDPPFATAQKWIALWSSVKKYLIMPIMFALLIAIFFLNDYIRKHENEIRKITEKKIEHSKNLDHYFCQHTLPLFDFFQQNQSGPVLAFVTCILKMIRPHELVSMNWSNEGDRFTLKCILGGTNPMSSNMRRALYYKLKHFFSEGGRNFGVQSIDIQQVKQANPQTVSLVIQGTF